MQLDSTKPWMVMAILLGLAVLGVWIWGFDSQASGPGDGEKEARPESQPLQVQPAAKPTVEEKAARRRLGAHELKTGDPSGPAGRLALKVLVLGTSAKALAHVEVFVLSSAARGFSTMDTGYLRQSTQVAKARTNAEGRCSFLLPRGRPFDLRAEGAGTLAPGRKTSCYAGQLVTIQLVASSVLEGRIMQAWDQEPAADVRLRAWRIDHQVLEGSTGPDGHFRFVDLPPCSFTLAITPRFGVTPSWTILQLLPGQVLRHDVTLERGSTFKGTVVDGETKQPIEGAEVSEGWTFRRTVRSNAKGEYVMADFPPPGVHELHARAKGYGRQGRRIKRPKKKGAVVILNFELLQAGSATGQVADQGGQPLVGVYVAAAASETTVSEDLMDMNQQQIDWQSSRTDQGGAFTLRNLRPDVLHALFIRKPGYASLVYDFPRRCQAGKTLELGTFILPASSGIEGRLLDSLGKGIAGADVSLTGWNEDRFRLLGQPLRQKIQEAKALPAASGYVDWREARSDAEGRFRFTDLAAGSYELLARIGGRPQSTEKKIQLLPGQLLTGLELRLDLGGLELKGQVLLKSGVPLGNAFLTLESETPDGGRQGAAWLRSEGRFEFKGLKPGRYALVANSLGQKPEQNWIRTRFGDLAAGSTDLILTVKEAASLHGVLRDAQGKPAPEVLVVAFKREGMQATSQAYAKTDKQGRFKLMVGATEILDLLSREEDAGPNTTFRISYDPEPDSGWTVLKTGVTAGPDQVLLRLPQ